MNVFVPLSRGVLVFALILIDQLIAVPLSVSTTDREQVRAFYNSLYELSEGKAIKWTGSYVTGNAGDTSDEYKASVLLRINFFRAMAGVPATTVFNPTYSKKAQEAALMMSANKSLNHYPPASWLFYTANGAEAAGKSNIAAGLSGPGAITGYMYDDGTNNSAVGHRRWLLYPQTREMGTGDVPGSTDANAYPAANATWVIDSYISTARPSVRDDFVAWPPKGYVPYSLVFPRWSFSYPNADFSTALVSATKNGQAVATQKEIVSTSVGENSIVWFTDGQKSALSKPATETTYTINITGVKIAGANKDFAYTVTVIDPSVQTLGSSLTSITGPSTVNAGDSTPFSISSPLWLEAFEYRVLQATPTTLAYGAEGGLQGLVAELNGASYSPFQSSAVATGAGAYHLAHGVINTQRLSLPDAYTVNAGDTATLTFKSRLGYAFPTQVARVQISYNEGVSWSDLWTQAGAGNAGEQAGFSVKSISLNEAAGKTFKLSFAYTFAGSGSYYNQTTANTGWLFDDINVTGLSTVKELIPASSAYGKGFNFSSSSPGSYLLQSRGLIASTYPTEWSAAKTLEVSNNGSSSNIRLINLSLRTELEANQTLTAGLVVSGGSKPILARTSGPGLRPYLPETEKPRHMTNPYMELFNAKSLSMMVNDNWAGALSSFFAQAGAFPFPEGSKDAAFIANIGEASTIQIKGTEGGGICLVELYDLETQASPRLINISARNKVGTGGGVLVTGFVLSGQGTMKVLIRGVAARLARPPFNIPGTLTDPIIELYDSSQRIVASNDNWPDSLIPTFNAVGAFDLDSGSKDAALLVSLPAGRYTAQVRGANNGVGEAIVEVYEVP